MIDCNLQHKVVFAAFAVFMLMCVPASSQEKDSASSFPVFMLSYAPQLPGNDLASRFGIDHSVSLGLGWKTAGNWLWNVHFDKLFGEKVKENGLLDAISTKDGYLIDENGIYADVNLYERGYYAGGRLGKIFPILGPNMNSGILFMGGMGFLEHKIRIADRRNSTPQVAGDYKKGYDRLTNGLAVNEFLGYMYFGKKSAMSFYGGFEFFQAWTESRRSFNFDTRSQDQKKRFDSLYGFRIGWIVPFYRKAPDKYYYY